MKEKLIELLGLKPDATDADVLSAVSFNVAENANLRVKLEEKRALQRDESDFERQVQRRMAGGITRQQAETSERTQRDHDAGRIS